MCLGYHDDEEAVPGLMAFWRRTVHVISGIINCKRIYRSLPSSTTERLFDFP